MISPTELRIGNYVRIEIGLPTNRYHRVTAAGIFEIDEQIPLDKGIAINPIPLTTDILDKIDWNGYVKFNIGSYFKIDDVGHLYYRSDYTGINVDYLHQLQNLYHALTGKELEVNL